MSGRKPLDRAKSKYITPISEAEMACRLLEAAWRVRRPPGASAEAALAGLDPEDRDAYRRAARAAVEYFRECITNAQYVS